MGVYNLLGLCIALLLFKFGCFAGCFTLGGCLFSVIGAGLWCFPVGLLCGKWFSCLFLLLWWFIVGVC